MSVQNLNVSTNQIKSKDMKKNYPPEKQTNKSFTLAKIIVLLMLCLMPGLLLNAATVTGTSQCEDGPMTIGISSATPYQWYALFRMNPSDGSYTFIDATLTVTTTLEFGTKPSLPGKYEVYALATAPPPAPTIPNGTLVGYKWIYAKPNVLTAEITGTYTTSGSDFVICSGLGEVKIQASEATPGYYTSEWNVTYELYKDGSFVTGSSKTSGSSVTHTWTGLGVGTYTVKAYRNLSGCVTNMTGSFNMVWG